MWLTTTRQFVVALALVSLVGSCARGDTSDASEVRSFVEVTVSDVAAGYTARANVQHFDEIHVVAQESAIVTAVHVEDGAAVFDGDVLLELDSSPVVAVETDVVFWRPLSPGVEGEDVAALQDFLHRQGFMSETATGRFDAATRRAVRRWQESTGHPLTTELPLGTLVPWRGGASAGQVVAPGSRVGVGDALLVMRGPGQTLAIELTGAQVDRLRPDHSYVFATDGEEIRGTFARAETEESVSDTGEVLHRVVVAITPDDPLPSGFGGPVRIVEERRDDVLTVPVNAVYSGDDGGTVVWSESTTGTLQQVPVVLGLSDGSRVEIREGEVRAGSRVAIVP